MKFPFPLTWPATAVIIAGGAAFTAILLWAPPTVQQWLFGANGLVCALIASFLRPPDRQAAASAAAPVPAAEPTTPPTEAP